MTRDQACIQFLQWALPQIDLRWLGFRKVRRQVCRRVRKRLVELKLSDFSDYKVYLEENADEWSVLDTFCRIPISRFYRDRGLFYRLQLDILPELARKALEEGRPLRCWSVACAAGEEPYTLALIISFVLKPIFPDLLVEMVATDIDEQNIARAHRGFFSQGSLKELPPEWKQQAFTRRKDGYFLRPAFRRMVSFQQLDIRREQPPGHFDLVLCRNLVATYFAKGLQRTVFETIRRRMVSEGYLVLGGHEDLPANTAGFNMVDANLRIWQKKEF